MKKSERYLALILFLIYGLGTTFWGNYPFYKYNLYSNSPHFLYIYTFSDQNGSPIYPEQIGFAYLESGAGRTTASVYNRHQKVTDEVLAHEVFSYLQSHPETSLVNVQQISYGQTDSQSLSEDRSRKWSFKHP